MAQRITVPARKGLAVRLQPGQAIKVINTTGTQVVDFWAVSLPDGERVLSMSHTRAGGQRLIPRVGDELLDSERSPMMRFAEITPRQVPQPFNLFMNIPWDADGGLRFTPSVSKVGDYVVIAAVVPCVAVVSSCPQDIIPINGPDASPTEFDIEVVST